MKYKFLKIVSACSMLIGGINISAQQGAVLWYDKPAIHWEEALPLGNGRLGAMVYGNPVNEEIQLNEETISAGSPYANHNPNAREALPAVRQLIFDGKYLEAQEMIGEKFMSQKGRGMAYKTAGSLLLNFEGQDNYTNFRRQLDLDKAVATTTYTVDGVDYNREVFTSFADNMVTVKLTASKPGKLTFTSALTCPLETKVTIPATNHIVMEGNTGGYMARGIEAGLKFRTDLKLDIQGGKSSIVNDTLLSVQNANSAIIYIAIATNFVDYKDISADPVARNKVSLRNEGKNYDKALREHIAEYQKFYRRVNLELGRTPQVDKPTDVRIKDGYQVSPYTSPALFEGVQNTLLQRGDVSTGWSMGWKVCFWARSLDGNSIV